MQFFCQIRGGISRLRFDYGANCGRMVRWLLASARSFENVKKATLLNVLFYHYLLENGVADDHIIRVDLENRMNKDLKNPDAMLHYVHDKIKDKELYYIIIDKVQESRSLTNINDSFKKNYCCQRSYYASPK